MSPNLVRSRSNTAHIHTELHHFLITSFSFITQTYTQTDRTENNTRLWRWHPTQQRLAARDATFKFQSAGEA